MKSATRGSPGAAGACTCALASAQAKPDAAVIPVRARRSGEGSGMPQGRTSQGHWSPKPDRGPRSFLGHRRHAMTRLARLPVTLIACAACLPLCSQAQETPAYPQQPYPAPQYPQPQYQQPQYQQPQFQQPQYAGQPYPGEPRKGRMRQFFAGTMATLLQGSGATSAVGISDMVVGGIADWFDRKKRRKEE